jgi:hypothetical protein
MMAPGKIRSYIVWSTVACLLVLATSCRDVARETTRSKVETKEKPPGHEVTSPQEADKTAKAAAPVKQAATTEVKPEEKKPAVRLALRFRPQDLTTYRVIEEVDRSVAWEGPPEKPTGFQGGHTGSRAEMTFGQTIQSVDENGNATAEIEIEALKYVYRVRDNAVLNFDSAAEQDKDSPLQKLIGQSYVVQMSAAGQVLKIVDANEARAAVTGNEAANKTALALLSPEVISQRHTIPALPPADKNELSPGQSWSSVKAFSFDMMGSKSYEKAYTLKEIKKTGDQQLAIVEMNGVPSTAMAQELDKGQVTNPFEKMFDTTETYTGQLELDLAAGKVKRCLEELRVGWVIVDPQPKEDKQPAALRMAATRLYSIEQID